MQYLLDTVAVVRHFTGSGSIGRAASEILDNVERRGDLLAISVVSLMEILYLSEKNRIALSLSDAIDQIDNSAHYLIINLTPEILEVASLLDFYELHDRLILATAKWLGAPVLSSDQAFRDIPGVPVIWD